MRAARKAFTLIELLVVIMIIALLMAILLPALNRAREAAKRVRCAAQMRQWAFGVHQYAVDNDGAFPFWAGQWDLRTHSPKDEATMWHNKVGRYLGQRAHVGEGAKRFEASLTEVRKCPSGRRNNATNYIQQWGGWEGWIGTHYGGWSTNQIAPFIVGELWNGSNLVKSSKPVYMQSVKRLSSWLLLLDCRTYTCSSPAAGGWPWTGDLDGDGINESNRQYASTNNIYNGANPKVHAGGCNVALCDGHQEWIRYEELWELDQNGSSPAHEYWWKNR